MVPRTTSTKVKLLSRRYGMYKGHLIIIFGFLEAYICFYVFMFCVEFQLLPINKCIGVPIDYNYNNNTIY